MKTEKVLYPKHPARVISAGPSEFGKSIFLTNITSNNINDYDKINFYSPSLHQNFYERLIKRFKNYKPVHIIPNVLNGDDIDIVIDEVNKNKDFENFDSEIQTYNGVKELKYPQDFDKGCIIILADLNQKERKILGYKLCSIDIDTKIYLFS